MFLGLYVPLTWMICEVFFFFSFLSIYHMVLVLVVLRMSFVMRIPFDSGIWALVCFLLLYPLVQSHGWSSGSVLSIRTQVLQDLNRTQ